VGGSQILLVGTCVLLLSGCAGSGWGARTALPDSWQDLGRAARAAAVKPEVWVPLSGAVVLGVADLDDNVSEWAVREQPLFGSNAADVSDDLLDVSAGLLVLSAVLAPADTTADRLKGIATQAGTLLLTGGVTEGLKGLTARSRPNGRSNNSLPSGHASQAAARTHLTRTNLEYFQLADRTRRVADVGLHTLGYATGWARVEANVHFPSDVLAGIAIGNFFSEFLRAALFEPDPGDPSQLSVQVLPGGAVLQFSQKLR